MSAAEKINPEELAGIARTCQIVGLSKSNVYQRIRAGTFPKPITVGGRTLWPVSRLYAWVHLQIREAEKRKPLTLVKTPHDDGSA